MLDEKKSIELRSMSSLKNITDDKSDCKKSFHSFEKVEKQSEKKSSFKKCASQLEPTLLDHVKKKGGRRPKRRGRRGEGQGMVNQSYMNDLMVYYNNKKKGGFFLKRLKTFFRIGYYTLSSLLNIFSIGIFIIDNQDSKDEGSTLSEIDFYLACYFLAELVFSLMFSSNRMKILKSRDMVVDVLSITPSFFTRFSNLDVNLSFLRILRILRVMRVFRLYKYLKLVKPENNDAYEIRFSSSFSFSKVKRQLFSLGVMMMAVIFISAGAVTLIDQSQEGSFKMKKLTFIDAIYFIIITSSTIGFGDISPTTTISRFFTILVLLVTLYIVSDQLTKVVNLLRMNDKGDVTYTFSNHIILIGDFNTFSLYTFLEEIYGYSKKGPMMIIIYLNNNDLDFEEFSRLPAFKKKIFLLPCKKYDIETFVKANFKECEYIFCLNQNMDRNCISRDRILSFHIKNINLYNKIESTDGKFKKLYTQYLSQEKNFKFAFMPLQISFPSMNLKTSLIVKSIFNKGYLTFITNLFNSSKPPVIPTDHVFIKNYIKGMKMNLLVNKLPSNLPAMHMKAASHLIYEFSTKTVWDVDDSGYEKESDQAVLLIGMMMINLPKDSKDKIEIDSLEIGNCIDKISFDPEEYTASNALGIFIYSSKDKLKRMVKKFEESSVEKPEGKHKNSALANGFKGIFNNYTQRQLNSITNTYYRLNYANPKSRFFNCEQFANTNIKDHIIILGISNFIDQIVSKIRVHSLSHPIVILTDSLEEGMKIKLFQRFKNLFIVKGDHLELKNLYNIKTKLARFVIILSSKSPNTLNSDSNSILAAKMVEQYFNVPYSLEIVDSVNSQFLGHIPHIDNVEGDFVTEYIYPHFMQGNIFFTDFLDKLIARSFKTLFQAAAFKALINQDYSLKVNEKSMKNNKTVEVEDNFMKNLIEENIETEIFKRSKLSIFSFEVPEELVGKTYDDLIDELYNSKDVFIPLGIYVENYSLEHIKQKIDVKLGNEFDEIYKMKKEAQKYYNIYKQNFSNEKLDFVFFDEVESGMFLTNPSKKMTLVKGMSVMCMSVLKKTERKKKQGKRPIKKLNACEKFFKENEMIDNMQAFQQKMKFTKAILDRFDGKIQEIEEKEFKLGEN